MLRPMRAAVVIPVKRFTQAKARLSQALDAQARVDLAQAMTATVIRAAAPLPVVVVCDDLAVAEWAVVFGAEALLRPGMGLNAAVTSAVDEMARRGIDRVLVAHGDLPLARTFEHIVHHDAVTIVPDRHDDGTNVLCLPAATPFTFAYGPGSFRRHQLEVARLGLTLRVVRDPLLGWDVDEPADLEKVTQWTTPASHH